MLFENCKMVFRVVEAGFWEADDCEWDVNALDGLEVVSVLREGEWWDIELEDGTQLWSVRGIHIELVKR